MPDCVLETTRKYKGEEYNFRLDIGETTDWFIITSPKNCWGYEDTYLYDCKRKCGFWSWRYHPRWITKRIRAVCDRLYEKYDMETATESVKKLLIENGIKFPKKAKYRELEDLYIEHIASKRTNRNPVKTN